MNVQLHFHVLAVALLSMFPLLLGLAYAKYDKSATLIPSPSKVKNFWTFQFKLIQHPSFLKFW